MVFKERRMENNRMVEVFEDNKGQEHFVDSEFAKLNGDAAAFCLSELIGRGVYDD